MIGVMPALNRLQLFNTDSLSEEAAYVILGVEENITNTALKKRSVHYRAAVVVLKDRLHIPHCQFSQRFRKLLAVKYDGPHF